MSAPATTGGGTAPPGRGPARGARVRPQVLVPAAVAIIVIAAWAVIAPDSAETVIGVAVAWMGNWFGWFYILLGTAVLVFVIALAASRYGRIRLGPDHSRPEYSTATWAAMLFAAGIGTDIMFFSVAEPVAQYMAPPQIEPETIQAAREATVWSLFHYGLTGWGMYALMGIALGYFAHRKGLPLAVRSAFYPLIGKRINGIIGHTVDTATVLGTIFGVATSLGIGVVQLNVGLELIFGIDQGIAAQIGLTVLAVTIATISATTGIDRGIRVLSQLNVVLAVFLTLWVLVSGKTAFLLNGLVTNVGDFISMFPGMTLNAMPFDHPADWMAAWTLFFWAWWVAWASFVGMFLARISRGRTIREFVIGAMAIPFTYILMWMSIFGNSAIDRIRSGDREFGLMAAETPELGFYTLLQDYPGAFFLIGLATFVGLLFYVTSADSGALVMANLCSDIPKDTEDAAPWLRIFWAVVTGVLTIAMLVVDGIPALQSATIIMGLPFAFVMVFVMVAIAKAMRIEGIQADSHQRTLTPAMLGAPTSGASSNWRIRLGQVFSTVTRDQASKRLREVVAPTLEEVAQEMTNRGYEARTLSGIDPDYATELDPEPRFVALEIGPPESAFGYRATVRLRRAPSFGARVTEADDMVARLEVALPDDGGNYDIMTYTPSQIAEDVLDCYERHAEADRDAVELLT